MYFTACKLFFRFFNLILVNIVKVNNRILGSQGAKNVLSALWIIIRSPHVGAVCCMLSALVNHLNPIPFQSIFRTNFIEAQATAKKETEKKRGPKAERIHSDNTHDV